MNPIATASSTLAWRVARNSLVGDYGLITMGLTYAIVIVLTVVTTLFLIFGALGDSGYISRFAIFSDRLFRATSLNGKAVPPRVLGIAHVDRGRVERLSALGVTLWASVEGLQTFPGIVFRCNQTELAIERAVAAAVLVEGGR